MNNYELFYADLNLGLGILNNYKKGDWLHASQGVVGSRLKGGLLSGCNIRVAYLPHPQANLAYRQEDQDYRNQQLIIFDDDLYFQVIDVYQFGNYAQILMSPVSNIEEYGLDEIIEFARKDFLNTYKTPPVAILDNKAWKAKVSKIPGMDSKNSPSKGFLTMYWK